MADRLGAGGLNRAPVPTVARRLELPYRPEQVFDLVVDVERYPRFVPGWRAVRVLERGAGRLRVEQVVGRGALSVRFVTEVRIRRPQFIRIRTDDRPLRHLVILWRFAPAPAGGARVAFRARYRLRAGPLSRLAGRLIEDRLARVVAAFEARAHALYGVDASRSQRPPLT